MIYLIDSIGNETGMNLYDKAFHDEFKKKGVAVTTLSNFQEEDVKPLLPNFYHGGGAKKILGLAKSWLKLLCFKIAHPKSVYVYQSFGLRFIDIILLSPFMFSKRTFVVVHDVFEITDGKKRGMKYKLQKFVYQHCIKNAICHSDQAIETLKSEAGFKGNVLFYPHFRYNFSKDFNEATIVEEVKNAVAPDKVNMLFFGQIRETKGIDVLIDAFENIETIENLNVIIAGSDKSEIMKDVKLPENVKAICRYIKDDELNYLFTKSQVVLLPYKEIYQSGVLETVVYFQKYAIMSDVRAFREFVEKYPSFGVTYAPNNGMALAECMNNAVAMSCEYSASDIQKYEDDHDIEILKKQMDAILK